MVVNRKNQAMSFVDQQSLVELLQQMVAIPSRNPPGEERALAEFLVAKALEWGLEAALVPEPFPARPQVVITHAGTEGKPVLVLNGHLDTVPEIDQQRWTVPPFGGIIRDGRLYGRGAADMKGGLAAALAAARALREAGPVLRGNLVIQAAVGEEKGEPGTRYLLMDKGIRGDWGIVLEPTELQLATAQRGLVWFHVIVKGVPGHAGNPADAVNPIGKAARVVEAIERYHRDLARRTHPLLGSPTATVTMINAGTKENVIPASCLCAIDRRTNPGETLDKVTAEVRSLLDSLRRDDPQFQYELQVVGEFTPAEIPESSELARVISRNIEDTFGHPALITGTPYGSDVRDFVNEARMPAVTIGPGSIANAHGFDEFVEIDQVVNCAKLLTAVAIDLIG